MANYTTYTLFAQLAWMENVGYNIKSINISVKDSYFIEVLRPLSSYVLW